jgi:lysyl-tRNA synthetase class 1
LREVIGRGTWLDKVAYEVVERERRLGRSLELIRVESGLGASGIPHIGSLGDAVRAYGVKLALEDQGFRSELIAFSDDMDGLRKVPAGLPDWLQEHIAKPVSSIPDPFRCHPSYGAHMSSMLLDALDRLGVKYRFMSGAEVYRQGLLKEQIDTILRNAGKIGRMIAEMTGQTKFEEVLPYYPVCQACGRIYVAQAHTYLADEGRVLYRCSGAELGGRWLEGCGHEGEARIDRGEGKLSWKGEFAARWAALDIRFEAYGKDIADSVRLNDRIAEEVLGYPPPYHVRYELFLDKSGRKISKSLGNVFTPQTWLRYGSPRSLLLLMFKRFEGTRTLAIDDIPNYMDEVDWLEDVYFGRVRVDNPAREVKLKGLYEYIHHLKPPAKPGPHIPYRLITQLGQLAPPDRRLEYVVKKLQEYRAIEAPSPEVLERVRLALNWVEDYGAPERRPTDLSGQERAAVQELVAFLKREEDPRRIQYEIFEIARRHGLEPPAFFKALYQIVLGTDRGPRLGPYLADLGRDRAIRILEAAVRGESAQGAG